MRNFSIILLFILLIFISALFFQLILAQDEEDVEEEEKPPECPPEPAAPSCDFCSSWTEPEYRCLGGCGGTLQTRSRTCWGGTVCSPEAITDAEGCIVGWDCVNCVSCNGCGDWSAWSDVASCDPCHPAKMCQTSPPGCVCLGSCYPAPPDSALLGLDKVKTDLKNVFDSEGKVKLPLILDWEDWQNWEDWDINGCSVNSYQYQIQGRGETITQCTTSSEAIMKDCILKSNTDYSWKIRACLDANCQDCGAWSGPWSFTTNLAPELVSPLDPDWVGPGYAEPIWDEAEIFPVHLNWCDVEEAKSYYMKNYRYEPGEEEKTDREEEDYCLTGFCPTIINATTTRKLPEVLKSENWFSLEEFTKGTLYDWQIATCLNEDGTRCGLACPADAAATNTCTQLSQKWSFRGQLDLFPPELISPKGQTVNMLDSLQWKHAAGANSYHYALWGQWVYPDGTLWTGIVEVPVPTDATNVFFKDIWTGFFVDADGKPLQFMLDVYFKWWVKSCWSKAWEEPHCEEAEEEGDFYTTGAPPTNLITDNTIIPVKLDWDDMPGAASYYYEVSIDAGFANIVIPQDQRVVANSGVLVDYPNLIQNTDYWWRVKTCADREGEVCGNWSETKSFTTFTLNEPTPIRPGDGEEFYTYERYLRWNEVAGARAYQYRIYYGAVEKIPLTKVPLNYAFIDTPRQLELGEHAWEVRACIDVDCQEVGSFGGPWSFEVVAKTPPGGGLVPCGRDVNVPDPYDIDETEPCGFHHIFILLRNILDFVLWRLGLIVLILLVLYSGIIFYFSGQLGMPDPLVQVRSLWKAAGMGYLIVFLAYTLINIFLAIMGYKTGIFGPWWTISF